MKRLLLFSFLQLAAHLTASATAMETEVWKPTNDDLKKIIMRYDHVRNRPRLLLSGSDTEVGYFHSYLRSHRPRSAPALQLKETTFTGHSGREKFNLEIIAVTSFALQYRWNGEAHILDRRLSIPVLLDTLAGPNRDRIQTITLIMIGGVFFEEFAKRFETQALAKACTPESHELVSSELAETDLENYYLQNDASKEPALYSEASDIELGCINKPLPRAKKK